MCCALPRAQRRVFGGCGFCPCLPGAGAGPGAAAGAAAGIGRWWLDEGVLWVERRGGGTAGGGFEAERRAWAGTGGARFEVVAELRRSPGPARGVDGVVGVGVVGAVCVDVGRTSTPSGMALRSLLVPAECCSSPSTARRRPLQRRAFGGSGLILGGRRMGASATRSVVERLSLRLGVMMPGFSRCEATAWTLREDADAGSSMPSLWAALILRRKSGASDDPRESIESMRVGDDVSGESGIVLPRDNVRAASSDSPMSIGDSCWTF